MSTEFLIACTLGTGGVAASCVPGVGEAMDGELMLDGKAPTWMRAAAGVVGEAKYTKGGLLKVSILDATEAGLLEIKGGSSVLDSTYQLRLQTYRSLIESQPYSIRTTRTINPTFHDWLQRWGVKVEGIE